MGKKKLHNILNNEVAVVTGGSRGIGRAIAVLLSQHGAKVIICARKIEDLNRTANLIKSKGGECYSIETDISKETEVENLFNTTLENYKRVDYLINNAGIGIYKPLVDSTLDDWERTINTNLRGPFLCLKAYGHEMIKQKKGCIINIVSGAGKRGFRNLSIYCASKFGLVGLSDAFKKEIKKDGIGIYNIYPGYTKTDFFRDFPSQFKLSDSAAEPDLIARKVFGKILLYKRIKKIGESYLVKTFLKKV